MAKSRVGGSFEELVAQWFAAGPRAQRALGDAVQKAVLEAPTRVEALPPLKTTPPALRAASARVRALGLRNAKKFDALLAWVQGLEPEWVTPIVHGWGNARELDALAPLAAWALTVDHPDVRIAGLYFFGHFLAKGGDVAPWASALKPLATDERKSAFYRRKVSADAEAVLRSAKLVTAPPKAPKSVAAAVKLLAMDAASQQVALAWLTQALVRDAADVRPAWPRLCKVLQSDDVVVRRSAAMLAVTALEEGAKASLVSERVGAALREQAQDPDDEVRTLVKRAISLLAR